MKLNFRRLFFGIAFVVFMALAFSGCTVSTAIGNSNSDALKSVNGTAGDVTFIANFIANNWSAHENSAAAAELKGAIAENSVSVNVGNPNPAGLQASVKTIDANLQQKLNDAYQAKLARIAVERQQIFAAVVNRFQGNLSAVQALLQGQQNYYATVGTNNSTIDTTIGSVLDAFQQFAPVLISKITPATAAATNATATATQGK